MHSCNRRNYPALRRSRHRVNNRAIAFQYASFQPTVDKPDKGRIVNAFFQHLEQPIR